MVSLHVRIKMSWQQNDVWSLVLFYMYFLYILSVTNPTFSCLYSFYATLTGMK